MAKLKENTVVVDRLGQATPLYAGDDVPRWAAKQVGDHLLEEAKASRSSRSSNEGAGSGSDDSTSEEPPRGGEGSGEDVWRAYAAGLGIEVPEDAGRDDIVALVDAFNGDQ